MIIILRGTSGSGKSYIVYQAIAALGPHDETFTLGPKNKLGGYLWHGPRVAVVGRYETACGGCDAFSWPGAADEIAARCRELETAGYRVILEGLLVSEWGVKRLAALGQDLAVVHLKTDLKDCLHAVQDRRDARAKAKGTEASPLNPNNTTRKYNAFISNTRRQRAYGIKIEELDRDAARERVFELLELR